MHHQLSMRALNRLSGCPTWSVYSQISHGFVRMVFQISRCNRDDLEIISHNSSGKHML